MDNFCEKLQNMFEVICRKFCKPLHIALYSKYNEHRALKTFMAIIWGLFLGFMFYLCILSPLHLPLCVEFILTSLVSVLLALGNAASIQVRCICLLTIPSFCGKAGRGVIKAIVLTFIIAGPIHNLVLNGRQVVRVFACTASLTQNLTLARYTLLAQPFKNAMFGINSDIADIKETLGSIRDVVAPIAEEIEGEDELKHLREENDHLDDFLGDTRRTDFIDHKFSLKENSTEEEIYQKKYMKKLEYRCQDQLTKGSQRCIKAFGDVYDKCTASMDWYVARLMCWPMKVTYFCNMLLIVGDQNICNSKLEIDPGIGESYAYLKKSKAALTADFKGVRLQYKVKHIRDLVDIQDAEETSQRILHNFQQKQAILESAIAIVNILLVLILVRVVLVSQRYHDLYVTNVEYDNCYMTRYFKKIDARRWARKHNGLLPLKKEERSRYIDVYSLKYMSSERSRLFCQSVKLTLEVVTATSFVMLDRIFYEALDVVAQHATVDTTQQGVQDLIIEVDGTGFLANIVRNVLSGLNTKMRTDRVVSNEQCLPRPHMLQELYLVKIYGCYLIVLILIFLEVYTLRLRRAVCAYFYPKCEKRRTLYAYNEGLRRRRRRRRPAARNCGALAALRRRHPRLLDWLTVLPAARDCCILCGEVKKFSWRRKKSDDWTHCSVLGCSAIYCSECWTELRRKCFVCAKPRDGQDNDISDEDFILD